MALASESTACGEALAVCASPEAILPEGEMRCEVTSLAADEGQSCATTEDSSCHQLHHALVTEVQRRHRVANRRFGA